MKAVTIEDLKKANVANPVKVYDQIAEIGGFGSFDRTFQPPLDLAGLPKETQERIAKLIADAKPAKK